MTSKQYDTSLIWILKFGYIFMFIEAVYHASGVRMTGVEAFWPDSAVQFARLFMMLWASASLVLAVVFYYVQKHFQQTKPLLVYLTLPAVLHSLMLVWLSLTPFTKIMPLANLYAWIPFYEVWIRGEATMLTLYVLYIAFGKWKKFI